MKNITFPAKLGTLAMAAVLATTVHASAQAIPTETVDCEDCEITAVDEGVIFEPTDETAVVIDEAEPVYPHSTWPEVGEMAPELPEPVFVGLPEMESTEIDDGETVVAIDESEPVYPHSTWPEVGEMAPELPVPVFAGFPVMESTEIDDGESVEVVAVEDLEPDLNIVDDGELTITSVDEETPVAAQSGIAVLTATDAGADDSSDSEFNRPVVVANASNNLCLNKQMYVSFLCAWQGFERPLN